VTKENLQNNKRFWCSSLITTNEAN